MGCGSSSLDATATRPPSAASTAALSAALMAVLGDEVDKLKAQKQEYWARGITAAEKARGGHFHFDDRFTVGMTPLHLAAKAGSRAVVDYILALPDGLGTTMSKSVELKSRYTPLHAAVAHFVLLDEDEQKPESVVAIVQALLAAGVDPFAKATDTEWSALHMTAACGAKDVAALLIPLYQPAHLEMGDRDGSTPLHIAAQEGHVSVCEQLLAAGAQLDALNRQKRTPLMLASLWAKPDAVRCLLSTGASTALRDADGKSAEELCGQCSPAPSTKQRDAAKLLLADK